jgi:glycosyltransferase involved in cell wall biosynthesis
MPDRPRIAIFLAYWRFHSSAAFAASLLARSGYDVDIFLYRADDESLPIDILKDDTGITIHSLLPHQFVQVKSAGSPAKSNRLLARLLRAPFVLTELVWAKVVNGLLLLASSDRGLIPSAVLKQTRLILGKRKYKAWIGVDKGGLVWAGLLARQCQTPLIYSSLELYTRDYALRRGFWYRRLKRAEEVFHRKCWATIVQDENRGKVLLEDNGVEPGMQMLYVPISRLGEAARIKPDWLRDRLGLSQGQTLVLNYGMMAEGRYSLALAELAQEFPPDWRLVFHGFGADKVIEGIRRRDLKGRVCLSLDMVDLSQESTVMASADISLVLYEKQNANDLFTAFSSEKIALSLQCGIPVIAFAYPGYEQLAAEGCAVLVKNLQEIPEAIATVLRDYNKYRANAFVAFEKYYRFETNFRKVTDALEQLNRPG